MERWKDKTNIRNNKERRIRSNTRRRVVDKENTYKRKGGINKEGGEEPNIRNIIGASL